MKNWDSIQSTESNLINTLNILQKCEYSIKEIILKSQKNDSICENVYLILYTVEK